jgi:hypothetical protein
LCTSNISTVSSGLPASPHFCWKFSFFGSRPVRSTTLARGERHAGQRPSFAAGFPLPDLPGHCEGTKPMTDLDLTTFKALSFDCYGTLIDW